MISIPDLPPLLTAQEVAQLLRTDRKVVWEMARLRQLPGVIRLGRKLLFRRDRLLQWLAERESSVPPPGEDP
jgi:excisionase family DNA binding protein